MTMEKVQKDQATRNRLETAFRAERGQFLARARSSGGSAAEAEDIVQDVFVSALANLESLANVANLGAWVFASIRNRVVDLWRKSQTRRQAGETTVAAETIDEIFAATGLGPQDQYLRDELNDALVDAIAALPPEQAMVINAQVLDGLSFREISEATGVPIDTLAGRKRYAIRNLGIALQEWMDDF